MRFAPGGLSRRYPARHGQPLDVASRLVWARPLLGIQDAVISRETLRRCSVMVPAMMPIVTLWAVHALMVTVFADPNVGVVGQYAPTVPPSVRRFRVFEVGLPFLVCHRFPLPRPALLPACPACDATSAKTGWNIGRAGMDCLR